MLEAVGALCRAMKGSSANRVGQTDALGQPLTQGAFASSSGTIGVDTDAIVRAGFIRKVYGILAIQLIVTFGKMPCPSWLVVTPIAVADHQRLWIRMATGEIAMFTFIDPLRALICAPPFTLGARNSEANQPMLAAFQQSHPHCVGGVEGQLYITPNSTAMTLMCESMPSS